MIRNHFVITHSLNDDLAFYEAIDTIDKEDVERKKHENKLQSDLSMIIGDQEEKKEDL